MKGLSFVNTKAHSFAKKLAIFVCFFDGWEHSKKTLESALDKNKSIKIVVYSIISILIMLFILALYATFISHLIFDKPTTFNVTVKTEEVKITTQDVPMSRWPLKDIELSKSCPDEPEDLKYEKFTGTISINPEVQLIITRIASGDLTVKMYSPDNNSVGYMFDEEDEEAGSLTNCAFFHIRNIPNRIDTGETIVLPITGNILAGHEIKFLNYYKNPVLLNGKITILDRSFFINENYSVGPFELDTGDSFEIQQLSVPSQGFALINLDPAITLVYRANGYRGVIKRFQAEDYVIRNTIWSKLIHDEILSSIWIVIVIVLGLLRAALRMAVE